MISLQLFLLRPIVAVGAVHLSLDRKHLVGAPYHLCRRKAIALGDTVRLSDRFFSPPCFAENEVNKSLEAFACIMFHQDRWPSKNRISLSQQNSRHMDSCYRWWLKLV